MTTRSLGIIGGSGLYDLPGLEDRQEHALETPFGAPSDSIITGSLHGVRMAFLPRHGRGHRLAPHELPFRANMHAMKQLGVEAVVGVSAVGSLQEHIKPGDLVIVDQFIDRTRGRTAESTFFGEGCVAHAIFAEPIWEPLRLQALDAARAAGADVHDGGVYVCIEGPHLSTRAESALYRNWGAHVIGMTNLQEAKLAREAEIAYATIAIVTDYDSWRDSGEPVDIRAILAVIRQNVDLARRVVDRLAQHLAASEPVNAAGEMRYAIVTQPAGISSEARRRLDLLIGRYLG